MLGGVTYFVLKIEGGVTNFVPGIRGGATNFVPRKNRKSSCPPLVINNEHSLSKEYHTQEGINGEALYCTDLGQNNIDGSDLSRHGICGDKSIGAV